MRLGSNQAPEPTGFARRLIFNPLAMKLLAERGFGSETYWEAFFETLPVFLGFIAIPLALHVACSVVAERIRHPALVLPAFIATFVVLAPQMFVLGPVGPGHAALDAGAWAWPACGLALFVKMIVVYFVRRFREVNPSEKLPANHSPELTGRSAP